MSKIRVGIIGTGFIGKQHIEAARRIPNVEVVAVCEHTEELAKAVANAFGIDHYFGDVDKMLSAGLDLDVVHNCTPSSMHYELNKKILHAGVNLYCEKPLTLTASESEELVELVKAKGLKGAVNFNYRHNATVEEMKQRIKNKSIGDVWFISAEYLQDWLLRETDFDWRVDAKYGGSSRAISDIGSHCFDTIQYIMDEKISAVRAKRYVAHPTRTVIKDGKEVKIEVENEDAALINVKFESGTEAVVRVSQVTAGKKNDFKILVEGTEQSLEWHQEKPDRLHIGNRDVGNVEIFADAKYLTDRAKEKINLPNGHAVGWADAFTNAIKSFYEHLKAPTPAHHEYVDLEAAHHIMKLIDACVTSDDSGQWIDV